MDYTKRFKYKVPKSLFAYFICCFIVNIATCREIVNVKCKNLDSVWCHLEKVNLEKKLYSIVPVSNVKDEVIFVDFRSSLSDPSVVPIFSADGICTAFRELRTLFIYEMLIEELEPDAFKACSKLEDLSLRQNRFKYLSSSQFVGLRNMWRLDIYNCELLDFDLEKTMESLPKFKLISINYNRIECERMKAMKRATDMIGVEFHDYSRGEAVNDSYNYHCVSKARHDEEVKQFLLSGDSVSKSLTAEERNRLSGDVTEFSCNSPNDDEGTCTSLSKCDNMRELLRNTTVEQEAKQYFSRSICGWADSTPLVRR